MKRTRCAVIALLIFCFFMLATCAGAQHLIFHLDPARTQIRWKLHENLHVIHGTFAFNGGVLALNSTTGDAQGELLVDIDSIQSGSQDRDTRLKREVLETGKYPQAFFHPTHISGILIEGTGQRMMLGGVFNIHGNDHPFTVSVHMERKGDQADVATQFKIPYVAWGMKRPGGFLWRFGKEVEIEISSHATVEEVP
jgi:polyisoprenoid-binding protein YceI